MKWCLVLGLLMASSLTFAENTVKRHFKTDKCTGWSEGTRSQPDLWTHCCVEHDFHMWAGGSPEDRKNADKKLRSCIEATGHDDNARMVYLGVRLGSLSPFKLKDKKWSHAWSEERDEGSLTEEEMSLLETDLRENPGDISEVQIEELLQSLRAR